MTILTARRGPMRDPRSRRPRPLARAILVAGALMLAAIGSTACGAEKLDYRAVDPRLTVVQLDEHPTESFLAVRADSAGRLFVGGREALFVYEPDGEGGFGPRRELYRFPNHTWVYDIALRGHDIYVLTVSALYVLPDAVVRREGIQARRLIWGVPLGHVHQCFHGLAWGPEGKLYLSMGDPLWYYGDFERPDHWGHWTFFCQPEGTRIPYNGVGGVFRCDPDGSGFEVVARGLRNSCGLAFDRHWNLFTNDNDHEGVPAYYVPGRLIHVMPHAYFSWPRGWLVRKFPDRADLLETMHPDLGRSVPVGQSYYDEPLLPEEYRHNLLVARWGVRAVTRYPLRRRGASFRADEEVLVEGENLARPVGVSVGPDGRIFFTIAHMAHNEGSPTYRSELAMVVPKDAGPVAADGYDPLAASRQRLYAELSAESWERRRRAHVELLRRGDGATAAARERLSAGASEDDPARPHLVWLAASTKDGQAKERLARLAARANASRDERLQAIGALAEFYFGEGDAEPEDMELVEKLLGDPDPQIRLAAVLALFELEGARLPQALIGGPATSRDTYLRHAATMLLAERASLEELEELCGHHDPRVRLAGVLAAGFRLTLPPATGSLPAHVPLEPHRGGDEAYVIEFDDATIDLRDLGRTGNYTMADYWRAGWHTPQQELLFKLLRGMLGDLDEQVRLQAAHFLSVLNDPRSEPKVARVRRETAQRRLAIQRPKLIDEIWLAGPFPDQGDGFERAHGPQEGAVDLTAGYEAGGRKVNWRRAKTVRLYDFTKLYGGDLDYASFYAYFRLDSARRGLAGLLVGSDDGVKVWQNGRVVWTKDVSRGALPYQDELTLELEPGGNDILVRVRNRSGSTGLYLHYRTLGNVVARVPEKVGLSDLAERLKSAGDDSGAQRVPEGFLEVDWKQGVAQGDAREGRKLFEKIGCAKCHAVSATRTVEGGPSLAAAAKRFTLAHLVESILLPSKTVSPIFRATTIATADGRVLTGLVVGETGEHVELLLPDASRKKIAKSNVNQRALKDLSPMPQGIVKNPTELKHLLAYLLSDLPEQDTDR